MTEQIYTSLNRPRANLPGLIENPGIPLDLDSKGWPLKTIENFYLAMEWDYTMSHVKYNELAQCAEYRDHGVNFEPIIRRWTDDELAWLEQHLETDFGLYSPQKFRSALRLFYKEHRFHPIRDKLKEIRWDGVGRIEGFLSR